MIDEHPVIRMHDFYKWQTRPDYGIRTDYTVIPGPWPARNQNEVFLREFPEKCKPSRAWLAYTLRPKQMMKEHLGLPVLWHDVEFFERMLKPERPGIVEVVPTRGAAAVLIAMEMGATHIRMMGFDSVATGRITEYPKGAGRVKELRSLGKSYNSRHDYERERDALIKIAGERNVTLETFLTEPMTMVAN